jgi:alpha-D-ribose 1-methylphosphonate 5-triphosphate synthase subunit PhnG
MTLNQDELKGSGVLDGGNNTARQRWMGILARATGDEISGLLAGVEPQPSYELIKRPETGTLMLEGRAGGAGQRFNMGEATMTRCVIRLPDGTMGFSYALGRDRKKAEHSAVLDALLQSATPEAEVLHAGIDAMARKQAEARHMASRKAAATKVNFFTLVRGDG